MQERTDPVGTTNTDICYIEEIPNPKIIIEEYAEAISGSRYEESIILGEIIEDPETVSKPIPSPEEVGFFTERLSRYDTEVYNALHVMLVSGEIHPDRFLNLFAFLELEDLYQKFTRKKVNRINTYVEVCNKKEKKNGSNGRAYNDNKIQGRVLLFNKTYTSNRLRILKELGL